MMPKVKLCGMRRLEDIEIANRFRPDYAGFVFAKGRRRYIAPEEAMRLRERLLPQIAPVGVFVDEEPGCVAELLNRGVIEIAQLHGHEDEDYLAQLRALTEKPVIQAFRIDSERDVERAQESSAWMVLADHGSGGTGQTFDWKLLKNLKRPFFLAGGLHARNVTQAVRTLNPYAVDVSSGLETDGYKDAAKAEAFFAQVRGRQEFRVTVE